MTVPSAGPAGPIDRARAALDGGRPEAALKLLELALTDNPDDTAVWCLLSLTHLRLDDAAAALAAANRAVATAPDEEWPHRLASIALEHLKMPADAVRAAQSAVERAPYLWAAHVQLASALRISRQLPLAMVSARQAVELGPTQAEAHAELGRVFLDQRKPVEAEAAFRQALELEPTSAAARNELARAQLARRDYAGALTGFGAAAGLNPHLAAPRRNVAVVVRNVISRATYVAFIVIWGSALVRDHWSAQNSQNLTAAGRVGYVVSGLAVAAVLGVLVGQQLRQLSPALRSAVVSVVRNDRPLLGASVAIAICPVVLIVGAFLPGSLPAVATVLAFLLGLGARLACERSKAVARRTARNL